MKYRDSYCALDAAAISGLTDGDAVESWSDTSRNSHRVTQTDAARTPTFWTNVINGLPVVRFDGLDDSLDVGAIRDVSGGLHAIVVSQRLPPQVSGPRWQRIMSTWDGVGANDWSGSSWSIAASRDKAGDPVVFGPEIQVKKKAGGVEIDNVQLARNTQNGVQFFSGDHR